MEEKQRGRNVTNHYAYSAFVVWLLFLATFGLSLWLKTDISVALMVVAGCLTLSVGFDVYPPTEEQSSPLKSHWVSVFVFIIGVSTFLLWQGVDTTAASSVFLILVTAFSSRPVLQFRDKTAEVSFAKWLRMAMPMLPVVVFCLLLLYLMPGTFPPNYSGWYGLLLLVAMVYLMYTSYTQDLKDLLVAGGVYIVVCCLVHMFMSEGTTVVQELQWQAFWMSLLAAAHAVLIITTKVKWLLYRMQIPDHNASIRSDV
ncbi:MAG: hypothetical protein ACPGO5_01295 [Patescibacteria group bacterium]